MRCATMADDNVDVILPILQRIQADLGQLKTDVGEVKTEVRSLRGEFSAFKDMTEGRFNLIEHAILELSARVYVLEQRMTSVESRFPKA